jgi:predicted membrane protein
MQGYIYPNEFELRWSLLIVLYPYLTGLVAGAFILASLARVFNVKEVEPTYRLALLTALAFLILCRCWHTWVTRSDPTRSSSHRTASRPWRCSASCTPGT